MSPGQHAAGGPGTQPLAPAGRRPGYRGSGPRRRGISLGWLIALLVLLALVVAAAALYITTSSPGSNQGAITTTTAGRTTTTLAPAPPVSGVVATWKLTTPVRDAAAVPGPAGHLLVLGGETGSGASADGVFTLDLSSGALHQVDSLPVAEHDGPAAVLGGKVIVVGGSTGTADVTSVQIFPITSPSSATTIRKASAGGPLPAPRAGAGALTVGPVCYVVGGFDVAKAEPKVLSTTDGKTWTAVSTLPVPVQDAAVAAAGGELYVFGGSGGSATKVVTDVQRVDLGTGASTVVGQLPKALRGASAMVDGPFIYIAGGQGASSGTGTSSTVYAFDTRDDKVSVAGHLARPVAYAATAVIGGKEWLIGGESGGRPVATVQELAPSASGAVTTTPSSAPPTPTTS